MTDTTVIKMITQPARCLFPSLDKTESFAGVDSGKYAVTLEFDPKDVAEIEKSIESIMPKGGSNPLKQNASDDQYSPNAFRLKAKSRFKVKIIDKKKEDVSPGDISTGDEVRASIGLAAYSTGANTGVTVYLNGLQLLSGGSSSTVDFGDLPEGYGEGDDLPF